MTQSSCRVARPGRYTLTGRARLSVLSCGVGWVSDSDLHEAPGPPPLLHCRARFGSGQPAGIDTGARGPGRICLCRLSAAGPAPWPMQLSPTRSRWLVPALPARRRPCSPPSPSDAALGWAEGGGGVKCACGGRAGPGPRLVPNRPPDRAAVGKSVGGQERRRHRRPLRPCRHRFATHSHGYRAARPQTKPFPPDACRR